MIDLDPQCNLTICSIDEETLHTIWREEDEYINDYETAFNSAPKSNNKEVLSKSRSIHFMLKPVEDGIKDLDTPPPPIRVKANLDLIPGRLTVYNYENKISERWSGVYQGDPLSIRTITSIRNICDLYSSQYSYDFVVIDTSPSLGALNKVIISTVDGFIIPCLPDMFSLYGIRNIGDALTKWKFEFETVYKLISDVKREKFPKEFVQFLGYTIYNAKKYTGKTEWDLALAHDHFAKQIPATINKYIPRDVMAKAPYDIMTQPIGGTAVMHTHNTLPNMAQKYKHPIWEIPYLNNLEETDRLTIFGNKDNYTLTREAYKEFADDFLVRLGYLK
jgi:cellulose biosynthesis protein BcsQ